MTPPEIRRLLEQWREEVLTMRADIPNYPGNAVQLEESAGTLEACIEELEAALCASNNERSS